MEVKDDNLKNYISPAQRDEELRKMTKRRKVGVCAGIGTAGVFNLYSFIVGTFFDMGQDKYNQ